MQSLVDFNVEDHSRWVRRMAERVKRKIGAYNVQEDDLHQEGLITLWRIARRFDPERGVGFRKWAYHRVYGSMVDFIRAKGGIFSYRRKNKAKFSPSVFQKAEGMDDPAPEVDYQYDWRDDAKDLIKFAKRYSDGLTQRECDFITLRYVKGRTLNEVGKELGISESGACVIENRLANRMRENLHAAGLNWQTAMA